MRNIFKVVALSSLFLLIIIIIVCLGTNISKKTKNEVSSEFIITAYNKNAEESLSFIDEIKDTFLINNSSEADSFIKILNLNEDEDLCIKEDYNIEWESKNIDQVLIKLIKEDKTYYITDSYISSEDGINQYVWNSGKISKDYLIGDNFKLNITSDDVWDIQNTVLSFKKCDKSIDIQ